MKKVSRRKLAKVTVDLLHASKNRRQVIRSLAAFLIEHKMTDQIDLLLADIARLLADTEGDMLAEVTSAFALTPTGRAEITRYVRAHTSAKHVELSETIDQALLGGFTLRIPGQELDASVRHKLNQLQS